MSYDSTSVSDRNLARGMLGDIDTTAELRADSHYDAMITLYGLSDAVAFIASSLAAQYASEPTDVTLPNGLRVAWKDRIATWLALATTIRAGGVTGGAAFSVATTRGDGYADYAAERAAS
jgi:hypothetical protein